MKMKLTVLAIVAASSTAFAQPTKLELVGEGTARAAAEFLKITITASALCRSTAQEARQDLDGIVESVKTILAPHADKTVEGQVQVLPSAANRNAVIVYEEDGSRRTLCAAGKAWSTNSTLIFKLTSLDQIEELQDAVLGINTENELSQVAMGAPQPGIFSATYDKLVDTALEKAVADAERQAQILIQRTGGQTLSLAKVQPTQDSSGAVSYDRTQLGGDESAQNQTSVSVSVSRLFTFLVK